MQPSSCTAALNSVVSRRRIAAGLYVVPSALLFLFLSGCDSASSTEKPSKQPAKVAQEVSEGPATAPADSPNEKEQASQASKRLVSASGFLTEVTSAVGIPEAEPWPDGYYLTPEITPGGLGLIDFDQDGDLDIYQVRHCAPREMPESFRAPAKNRLYRQEADGRFVEVKGAAGLDDAGYGHGCAMGDIDNDGDVDVLVTNYGRNTLYLNESGRFRDVTESAGITGLHWSSAAAFFDYDQDGDLDLFVVHFGVFDAGRRCGISGNETSPDYCGPHLFNGVNDQLFRNNGDGTFTDVSKAAGINSAARGWGVICADLTEDGLPDIYVCNDEEPNQLWVNGGDGTFFDEAMLMGAAVNSAGRVEASMGVTVGDVNSDGRFDLFMTHVASETNTLYTSAGDDLFGDSSAGSGMAGVDLPYTGWGCGLVDIDHDGDLDLAVANGRVAVGPVLPKSNLGDYWNRYAEPNLFFENDGQGRFTNIEDKAGGFVATPGLTRGLAFGDLDNDGDVDLVTSSINNKLSVYRNDAPKKGDWLQVRALTGNRDAIGARMELVQGDEVHVRYLLRSYSYLASNDPRLHFGIKSNSEECRLRVLWPDGVREAFAVDKLNQVITIKQGEGTLIDEN